MPQARPIEERFQEKFITEPNSGCWLWTAAVFSGGYGCIGESGTRKVLPAHRVSWEIHNGKIPSGLWVLHRCDVRPCVNPDHLFLGDLQANASDMVAKGRSKKGKKYGPQKNPGRDFHSKGQDCSWAKLSDRDALEILNSKEKGAVLAARFGISATVISAIRHRRAWKHLEVS